MSNRKELTFGAGLWMFGQFVDRYATDAYGPPVGVLEAIDRAGQVGDLVALDINYPFDEGVTADQVRTALERNRLRCYAITPASYSRKFQKGALTNPDSQLRQEAIDLYKSSVPVARELGAKYVKFWPGQDGYDYPFQADYEALWRYSVEGVREVRLFSRHAIRDRVQVQGAAHTHVLQQRRKHVARHPGDGREERRNRIRSRPLLACERDPCGSGAACSPP